KTTTTSLHRLLGQAAHEHDAEAVTPVGGAYEEILEIQRRLGAPGGISKEVESEPRHFFPLAGEEDVKARMIAEAVAQKIGWRRGDVAGSAFVLGQLANEREDLVDIGCGGRADGQRGCHAVPTL